MTKSLKLRTALVTGSTSGIGLAIAERLVKDGITVILNGIGSETAIEQAVEKVEKACCNGAQVDFIGADLRDPSQIKDMMDTIITKYGSIDLLVNNAGVQHTECLETFPIEKWDQIIGVNLSSVFHTTRSVLTVMQEQGYGRIVNIASCHGLVASKEKSAYVAAKHGVVGLTKVTALENAEQGITCNAICPAWVRTPLVEAQIVRKAEQERLSHEEAAKLILVEKEPSLRFTTTEQIADTVIFLTSSASDNITGSSFAMDGGWTAQ